MNFDFFLKFSKFRIGKLMSAEDFADKFHYQLTNVLIMMCVVLVGVKQYVFTPIQCWIPHEWSSAWEEYAENYCWVQDTYFADISNGPPPLKDDRERMRLSYYQWVPFVLGLQCLFFYLPHLVWKILSDRMGTNVNQLVRFASECATIDQDKRQKMIKYLAKELQKLMETKRDYRSKGCWYNCHNTLGKYLPCFWVGKRSGVFLIIIYLCVKILYLINAIVQLFVMKHFIGAKSSTFGLTLLIDLIQGKTWERNGMFPRVTWCDLPRRTVGQPIVRSLMCVLPVNMLNEKIYIFLWFWFLAGAVLIVISLISWITRMSFAKSRRSFIKKYLIILDTVPHDEKDLSKTFINQFLRHDGVFLLRMIALNAGELVAAEVIAEVWKIWKEYRNSREPQLPNTHPSAPPHPPDKRPLVKRKNNAKRTDMV